MTRMSKQSERRSVSPRRPRLSPGKTGPLKDNLPKGYKVHENALAAAEQGATVFIPKLSK